MATRLGYVGKNGVTYFHHDDINECCAFLRDNGLDDRHNGWCGPNTVGAICYSDGWYAFFSKCS